MPQENLSIIFAFVSAMVLTPVIMNFIQRKFRAHATAKQTAEAKRHWLRNKVIEFSGVPFLMIGGGIPFLVQGTHRLPSTLPNVIAILCLAFLFMVGGMTLLANVLGDRGAENYPDYFESQDKMSKRGVRTIAKFITLGSIAGLIVALLLSL